MVLVAFPGGPAVKTSPSSAEGAGLIPGQGAKIQHALWSKKIKNKNRSNIVTNSVKAFKMVYNNNQKSLQKKKKMWPGKVGLPGGILEL